MASLCNGKEIICIFIVAIYFDCRCAFRKFLIRNVV